MKVEIGFCTNEKIGSKMIRWGTLSNHSHCFIKYGGQVFHSTGAGGCHLTTVGAVSRYNIINNVIETDVSKKTYLALIKKHNGKPYSFLNLVGFCFAVALRKLGFPVRRNPLRDGTKAMFCSELCAELLKMSRPEIQAPEDVYRHITKHNT